MQSKVTRRERDELKRERAPVQDDRGEAEFQLLNRFWNNRMRRARETHYECRRIVTFQAQGQI